MNEMRPLKRLLVGLALWSGMVVGTSVATNDGAPSTMASVAPSAPPSPATVTATQNEWAPPVRIPATRTAPTTPVSSPRVDDHDTLQRDAEMTQQMSSPTASGPMFTGQTRDAQLDHSQSPGFVKALEQHQADIDRMLARPTR